ncbi:MAG: FtsW/RodA/SpoVE family cell cycle protein [Phycisphaerae bacterium]
MDDLRRRNAARASSIIVVAAALMAIGVVMIASATARLDRSIFAGAIWDGVFARQVVFVFIGLAIIVLARYAGAYVLARPALRDRAARLFYVLVLIGLVAALAPSIGSPHRGSYRWLRLTPLGHGIGFQPSEFAKLAVVGLLAALLADRNVDPRRWRRGFLRAACVVGLCCALVGKEDFGTAVLLALVGTLCLFVGGARLRHLLAFTTLGLCLFAALLVAAPYRLGRLTAYRDIWSDPQGAGYQPIQSLTAIAEGGWSGVGLGGGVQKYGYLPDSHSDFIFSIICEETGFLGGALVIGLYVTIVWLGLCTMWAARNSFERILAFGITATLSIQAALNVAVATVAAPTTGISLPLISAGGSGVVSFCLSLGILASVADRGRCAPLAAAPSRNRPHSTARRSTQRGALSW